MGKRKRIRETIRARGTTLSLEQSRKQSLSLSLHQLQTTVSKVNYDEIEYLKEYDIDFDIIDSGEKVKSGLPTEDTISFEEVEFDKDTRLSRILNFKDNYIITVYKDNSGIYKCYFEPPHWMVAKIKPEHKQVLNAIIRIIQRIADTFEFTHQLLLADPKNELEKIIGKLTQKEFVELLNGKDKILNDGDLSLIKNNVWLVWDDMSLPLTALFEKKNKE